MGSAVSGSAPEEERARIEAVLYTDNNWGRWGPDDELGAVNLVDPAKIVAACTSVSTGEVVSLSRELPTRPSPNNRRPASHYVKTELRSSGAGSVVDYIGLEYHGLVATHLDALCHTWGPRGMWNGRQPGEVVTMNGSSWAGVETLRRGIVTRGVMLDVPRHRGEPFVTHDNPVTGAELEAIARDQGVAVRPGDAVAVHCGRERWDAAMPLWGSEVDDEGNMRRPGLHASCLEFLKDTDCAALAWDMSDETPNPWDLPWTVHGALFALGTVLLDHCLLEPLAETCQRLGRQHFMFVVAPLVVVGGTGSPVNPLAIF